CWPRKASRWIDSRFVASGRLSFQKGERPAWLLPAGLQAKEGHDELNSNGRRLTLSFELPRGAYATLLVKLIEAHGSI
ncbi:MAG: hypothetical protein AB7K24_16760, partial [Gemmataceae bacterium]